MSTLLNRLLAFFALAAVCPVAPSAPSVEHEVAALLGQEFDEPAPGTPLRLAASSCTDYESLPVRVAGERQADWEAATVQCGGRRVELLKRRVTTAEGAAPRWRIEDVLLLPSFPAGGARYVAGEGEGECLLGGAPGTSFIALLRRRGDRPPAVEQVWTYDLDRGRMQQQAATRLDCRHVSQH